MSNKVADSFGSYFSGKEKYIHPTSLWFQCWDGFIAASSIFSSLAVTFRFSFKSDIPGLIYVLILFDLLYGINIVLKFHLAFRKEGSLITDRKKIWKQYLTNTFCLDLLSIIPFDLFAMLSAKPYTILNVLKCNRILRFYSLTSFFGKYEDQLGVNTKAIRSLKYFFVACMLMHSISCGWYSIACPNESEVDVVLCHHESWAVMKKQHMEMLTTLQRYIKCLYWATITATSTGYGDIHAVNANEKWYSVASMLIGIGFFFGPILGYMASTLTNADSKRARYIHRIDVISEHLKDKCVCMDTQRKVKDFYHHLWSRHQGTVKVKMFSDFPYVFQAEISLTLNKHILEQAPMFRGVGEDFKRMITMVIQPVMFLPKQVIFSASDIRHTLFYIEKGAVEIIDEDNKEKPPIILREGSFFGEVQLQLNIPQSATARAASYCELSMLDRTDLAKVVKHFPEAGKHISEVIERRCEEAAEHIRNKDVQPTGPRKKRFTIDKAVIRLTDKIQKDCDKNSSKGTSKRVIFHPNTTFLTSWHMFIAGLVVLYAFVHSYVACYGTSFANPGYGKSPNFKLIFGMLYIIDFIFLLDLCVKTCTAVYDENNGFLEDREVLWRLCLRSPLFWFDVISCFPLELFALTNATTYDVWLTATFLRSNRLLKLLKVSMLFNTLENEIRYNIVHIRIMKLSLLILGATHICACVWIFQACHGMNCAADSWAVSAGITNTTTLSSVYVTTLYWAAATMTSTGYGDITANTTKGEFIVLFVLITGLLLYGYCLSNIAAILTNKMSPKVEFLGRIKAVTSFMLEQHLSVSLIDRVESYLGLVWRVHRGEAVPGSVLLMRDLPDHLQQEVSFEEMNEFISKIPIFMNTDNSFLKKLSAKLITYVFVPGDMIVYSGDVGREMYIMRRGLVEVLSKDQSMAVATLGPGGYFGEVGLIFGESRTADVRAKTYCEVAMLRKSDLDEVLTNFPLIERQLLLTSQNATILEKIRRVAKDASKPPKAKKIDLIERNKRLRSHSIWRRVSLGLRLTEEESNINDEINNEFKAPYNQLHPVLKLLSYFLLRGTFDPHGRFLKVWMAVSVVLSCSFFFTIGLQVAFLQENTFILTLNYFKDGFFLLEMYIKLHICYYNSNGTLVTHPTATARNYLRTSFCIDIIASIPFDLLFLEDPVAYNFAKLNRALKIIRVVQYFNYLDEPIRGNPIYRQIKYAIYMFVVTHVFACFWFMLGCPFESHGDEDEEEGAFMFARSRMFIHSVHSHNHSHRHTQNMYGHEDEGHSCKDHSWATENGMELGEKSVLDQYITSMYWAAATTCSVGYGDIHAHLPNEMEVALVCMIVGVVLYGFIIASAAASLANADAQRARYQQRLDSINRFLKEQKISVNLEKRVKGFYEFLWNRNKGIDLENLFEGLPISLQADITLSLYKDIIESVPLFQGTELSFTKMLSLYIQPFLVPKGEYIVRKGDMGEEMFFINKGTVEVVSEHENPIVFDTMTPGRFFGEISTIFSCPRTASIRTQTNADIFVLKKKDLDVVLSHYPHIKKQIIETAEERQNLVKQRAAAAAEAARKKKEEEELRKKQEEEDRKMMEEDDSMEDEDSISQESGELEASGNYEDAIIAESFPAFITRKIFSLKSLLVEKSHFVIDVDSRAHIIPKLNCLFVFITFITTTYMACFHDYLTSMVVFNIMTEAFFYIEIYLKFHMVYYGPTGDKVTSLNEIAKNYRHGELPFDLLASLPLGLLCFAFPDNRMKYYSYLNLIHVLRLKRLSDLFRDWLKKLNINVLLIRMGENCAQIIIALQTFACIWYMVASPGNIVREHSWVAERSHHAKVSFTPFENYCDSVYWALATMTSTGYGDIHATNGLEKVFATLVMVIGKLIFGFVLGNVASTMANVEALRVQFEERFAVVQAHMREQQMPVDLQNRVVDFFQYIWRRNRGAKNEGLFKDLPPCLHGELCLEINGELLKQVPLFKGCDLPLIRLLCTKTKLIQFHQDEFISKKGDIGNEMYFIKKGLVHVLEEDVVLRDGDFFGERSVVSSTRRKTSTKAVTHVDMFCLSHGDLAQAFLSYPEEEERVRRNLERFA